MNFVREKNGYNTKDVDDYIFNLIKEKDGEIDILKQTIAELENQITDLSSSLAVFKSKKDSISSALINAVEKANQIEQSSKNVYKLKIQQLNLLYKKWEHLMEEMLEKYPNLTETSNVVDSVKNFKNSIKSVLEKDFQFESGTNYVKSDPIRALLEKINSKKNENIENKQEIVIKRKSTLTPQIKGSQPQLDLSKLSEVEKFLQSNDDVSKASENNFGKFVSIKKNDENGFDISEAVNPKEDLDEIMKAFDFFEEKK